jgi:hypothetical protein
MVVTYGGWDDAKPVLPEQRSNGLRRPLFFPSAQAGEAARLADTLRHYHLAISSGVGSISYE